MTYFAAGFGLTRSRISRIGTPVHLSPSRLHPVTQWMSAITSFEGSARSSPYSSDKPLSTAPKTLKSHFAISVLGTGPKWRSGHRSGAVSVWPGGMRAGSTPSGMRLLLNRDATQGEYRDAGILRFRPLEVTLWARSSAGRARESHSRGQGFESPRV